MNLKKKVIMHGGGGRSRRRNSGHKRKHGTRQHRKRRFVRSGGQDGVLNGSHTVLINAITQLLKEGVFKNDTEKANAEAKLEDIKNKLEKDTDKLMQLHREIKDNLLKFKDANPGPDSNNSSGFVTPVQGPRSRSSSV